MNFSKWKWMVSVTVAVIVISAGATLAFASDSGDAERITVEELKQMFAKNEPVTIIDVRGGDYDTSDAKIKGAIRIAPGEINAKIKDIPRDHPIVTYCSCSTDGGALAAAKVLRDNGFKNVRALRGGWPAWKEAGGAVEPKSMP